MFSSVVNKEIFSGVQCFCVLSDVTDVSSLVKLNFQFVPARVWAILLAHVTFHKNNLFLFIERFVTSYILKFIINFSLAGSPQKEYSCGTRVVTLFTDNQILLGCYLLWKTMLAMSKLEAWKETLGQEVKVWRFEKITIPVQI